MSTVADLGRAVAAVRQLFDAAACSCALADADGGELEFVAADGAGAAEITGVRIPVSRGIAGWAAMSGQPLAVGDVQSDARFARDVAESTRYVPEVILAAPLLDADGEVLGVLEVLDPVLPAGGEGTDRALAVLGTVATVVALLVARPGESDPAAGDASLSALAREVLAAVDRHRGTAP